MRKIFFIFSFFFLFSLNFNFLFAQEILPNCPHTFSTDLKMGDKHVDVLVLQQILNSDRRTVVALEGPGSPRRETGNFGEATRKALKKFQALFIEYIGVADGNLNEKTRIVLEAVCTKDKIQKEKNVSVLKKMENVQVITSASGDLQITLRSSVTSVAKNTEFKVSLLANKDLNEVKPEAIIIEGASLKDIRKISKREFSLIIIPTENAGSITVQVEADAVVDAANISNQRASNEVLVSVKAPGIFGNVTQTFGSVGSSVENLLNNIVSGTGGTVNYPSTGVGEQSGESSGFQNYSGSGYGGAGGGSGGSGGGGSGEQKQNSLSQMMNKLFGKQEDNGQYLDDSSNQESGGWDQSYDTEQNIKDIEIPSNIDPMCKTNYGINPGGSCPNVVRLTERVKITAMQACTLIKKRINSQSQFRTEECNRRVGGATESSHMSGMALDINVNNLTTSERESVFLVFKKNGFDNIGCYRKGSGNVHLDHRPGGPRRWGSSYHRDTFNPANCPIELIKVFGR